MFLPVTSTKLSIDFYKSQLSQTDRATLCITTKTMQTEAGLQYNNFAMVEVENTCDDRRFVAKKAEKSAFNVQSLEKVRSREVPYFQKYQNFIITMYECVEGSLFTENQLDPLSCFDVMDRLTYVAYTCYPHTVYTQKSLGLHEWVAITLIYDYMKGF